MFHSLVSDTKNEAAHGKPNSVLQPAGKLRSAFGATVSRDPLTGAASIPSISRMNMQRPTIVKAQSTCGNQAALRMLHHSTHSSAPVLQRKCACEGSGADCSECAERSLLQRVAGNQSEPNGVPPIVHEVLSTPGQPLDAEARAFMEPRFTDDFSQVRRQANAPVPARLAIGLPHDDFEREADTVAQRVMFSSAAPTDTPHDFSAVQIHTDSRAAESAQAVNALAYTVGSHIVFGAGQFAPGTHEGQRLLAHELTHVVQQGPSSGVVQRQEGMSGADADAAAEREYGGSGAPKSQKCGRPSWCPAGFCDPYRSEKLAEYYRAKNGGWLMLGISAAVNSRVVPLWQEYLAGGSSVKNLTPTFGTDFTNSPTTKKTTTFLFDELKKSLAATPPSVPLFSSVFIDIAKQIPKEIDALDDPASPNQMNFNVPKDIPGNIAGGIGKDQLACPAGAKPSPFNDERHASGMAMVTRFSAGELTVAPMINYLVKDTIDLCPGDCGTVLEQFATIPLSQFEATGISGDVPFTVDFPAPSLGPFTVSAPLAASSGPAPSPIKP